MKITAQFVRLGEDRFRLSTIKRYTVVDNKVKLWFSASRFKVQYLVIPFEDKFKAQQKIDLLDLLLCS